MRSALSSDRPHIEEAQLLGSLSEELSVRLQLAQPQQFTRRIQTLPQHSNARLIDGSDFGITFFLIHSQNRLAGEVGDVQQIGAVAGDYDLTLPAGFPQRIQQNAGRSRV